MMIDDEVGDDDGNGDDDDDDDDDGDADHFDVDNDDDDDDDATTVTKLGSVCAALIGRRDSPSPTVGNTASKLGSFVVPP